MIDEKDQDTIPESDTHKWIDDRVVDPETGQAGWYAIGGFTTEIPNWDGRSQ